MSSSRRGTDVSELPGYMASLCAVNGMDRSFRKRFSQQGNLVENG
jgi:hypothetical protein